MGLGLGWASGLGKHGGREGAGAGRGGRGGEGMGREGRGEGGGEARTVAGGVQVLPVGEGDDLVLGAVDELGEG